MGIDEEIYLFNPVTIKVTEKNIHIYDSYLIKSRKIMEEMLHFALEKMIMRYGKTHGRTVDDMIIEWRAHNFLYDLGLLRSHTKDVDLDTEETSLRKFLYRILSAFYLHN